MTRVSQGQMKKLLDLLSEDGVLENGKVMYTNTNKQNFWKRIALQLNSVEGGVYKNTWKWCKMWADWKNKTKKKVNILLKKKNYNFAEPLPTLTSLEIRLLRLIGYPLDGKSDFSEITLANKIELPDDTTINNNLDFMNEDYVVVQSNKGQSSDEEDNTALGYFAKSKHFNTESQEEENFTLKGDSSANDKKTKGKVKKKKSLHLAEYKIKATLAIEKEKTQQKSEELRLRAIELKLKADEIRLKEIEMNKINYLTNIEEEKLKCFKDISSSLHELLERTRNGTLRFHNI